MGVAGDVPGASQRIRSAKIRRIKRQISEGDWKRQLGVNVPVAGLPVKKKIPAVYLISRQVEVPDCAVVRNQKIHRRITGGAGSDGEEVPHLALVLPAAWLGELKLEKKLVPVRPFAVLEGHVEAQAQVVGSRLVAYYGLCKGIPDQLNGMVECPPGIQRTLEPFFDTLVGKLREGFGTVFGPNRHGYRHAAVRYHITPAMRG